MNEQLTKAEHDLGFAMDGLRQALASAGPVEAIVLGEIVASVGQIERRVHQFYEAWRAQK